MNSLPSGGLQHIGPHAETRDILRSPGVSLERNLSRRHCLLATLTLAILQQNSQFPHKTMCIIDTVAFVLYIFLLFATFITQSLLQCWDMKNTVK